MALSRDYLAIAPEIWLECWGLCDNAELRHLCLVCRFFLQLCQPLLFRIQSVCPPLPGIGPEPDNWILNLDATARRLDALAFSTHGLSVRVWLFRDTSGIEDLVEVLRDTYPDMANALPDAWNRVLGTFTKTLGLYRRITVLDLSEVTIDAGFRGTLESFDLLEVLLLSSCDIVCRTGTLLPLKRLEITGFTDEQPEETLEIVSPITINRLKINDSFDGASLLATLLHHQLPQLVHLSITLTAMVTDRFFAFLDSCPQLQSITIRYYPVPLASAPTIPNTIANTTVPVLKSYSGPASLAEIFVSGRPVEKVQLSNTDTPMTVHEIVAALLSISHSSIPLHSLTIDPCIPPADSPEVFGVILSLFPELRALTLKLSEEETIDEYAGSSSEELSQSEHGSDGQAEQSDGANASNADSSATGTHVSSQQAEASKGEDGELLSATASTASVPGFMYVDWWDESIPPTLECPTPAENSPSMTTFMDLLVTGRIVLPPHLEVLRFNQPPPWTVLQEFALSDQHTAILNLERLFPSLKEITFTEHGGDCWIRDHDVWTQDVGFVGASFGKRRVFRLISLVWKADGTRREE
ncbi:hypothetical protein B0H19DRAFT_1183728 [Mycena capillaripes]|nr:hypothetical protein B0H19DRAFT_1183728 [Mycena capillaripes]